MIKVEQKNFNQSTKIKVNEKTQSTRNEIEKEWKDLQTDDDEYDMICE